MLLFVVDVSAELGFGHLTRCLNLARLNRHKHDILFAFRHEKSAADIVKKNRFAYTSDFDIKSWERLPDAVVFDVCRLLPEYLHLRNRLKETPARVLQITDLGLNVLPETILIDGSLQADSTEPGYHHLGPRYMVLHHKVRHFHKRNRYFRPHIRHIFLSLGGAAPYRSLRTIVDRLCRHQYICTVAPGFLLKRNQKKILSRLYPSISWVGRTESLARALFQCDLAIVAPGITAYEAAATGTPALYLAHHELQQKTARLFENAGLGINLGLLSNVNPKTAIEKMAELTREDRSQMGNMGKKLVDGLGLYRVNALIFPGAPCTTIETILEE